jgi:hypothetical protein
MSACTTSCKIPTCPHPCEVLYKPQTPSLSRRLLPETFHVPITLGPTFSNSLKHDQALSNRKNLCLSLTVTSHQLALTLPNDTSTPPSNKPSTVNKAGGTVLQHSIPFGITQLIKQHTPLPPSNRDQDSVPEGKSVFGAETDSRVIPCSR